MTVKNKYIILNDTGLTIEYKQKGTPNPCSHTYQVWYRSSVKMHDMAEENVRDVVFMCGYLRPEI